MTRKLTVSAGLFIASLLVAGCGKSDSISSPPGSQEILTQIGWMYKEYTKDHKKTPKKLSDFDHPYEPGAIEGYAALRDGSYVMLWGGSLPGPSSETTVLAYEKSAPEKGGPVLFQSGTIRTLTAEEFQAAPKAGK
jgi:hypothetical protein